VPIGHLDAPVAGRVILPTGRGSGVRSSSSSSCSRAALASGVETNRLQCPKIDRVTTMMVRLPQHGLSLQSGHQCISSPRYIERRVAVRAHETIEALVKRQVSLRRTRCRLYAREQGTSWRNEETRQFLRLVHCSFHRECDNRAIRARMMLRSADSRGSFLFF
jgi:hypothetical protein